RDMRPRQSWRTVASRVPLLPLAMFVGVFVMFLELVWGGFLQALDESVAQIWVYQGPHGTPIADLFDKIGQRTVTGPVLFTVAYVLSRRIGSIRPLVIAAAGALAVNLVVGVIKVLTARESPRTGGPELFVGNNLFPSGHTSNIVMMFGLAAALIVRYGNVTTQQYLALVGGVVGIFVFMCAISIYRHTHWFTDLVAGGMVGAGVLDLCMRADANWSKIRAHIKQMSGPAWSSIERLTLHVRRAVFREGAAVKDAVARTTSTCDASPLPRISGARREVVVLGASRYDDYVADYQPAGRTFGPGGAQARGSDDPRRREPSISGRR
ncbi:MAG TPA: phosphatase PAP2 family protein, partial [Actinopolymorphaceae bacterium]